MWNFLIPQAFAQVGSVAQKEQETGTLAGILIYVWENLDNWIAGIVILILFYILAKAVSKSATNHLMAARGESMPENALFLVDRLVKISIIAIGIVIAGSLNGIQLGVVLGAVGFGFGFALKDIIGNMISSVIMLAQKHVNIGDLVEVAGTTGTISSIDTRVTVLQSLDGHKVIIPNQQMINEKITSFTSNPFRRLEIFTYISWDSDREKGMALIREVLNQYSEILKSPEPSVLLDNIEDESNFAIRVLFWIDSSKNWLEIQSNLHNRILRAFAEGGIDVAYPVRSLTISENIHDSLQNFKYVRDGVVPEEQEINYSDDQLLAAARSTKEVRVPRKLKEQTTMSTPLSASPISPAAGSATSSFVSPTAAVAVPSADVLQAPTSSVPPVVSTPPKEIPVAPGASKIALNLDNDSGKAD